jgi:hypothetical protein
MALTRDQKITRFGTGDRNEPINKGLKANVTVYRGSLAVCDSSGYLKNASVVATTDTCWGMIERVGTGCAQIDGAPGITGGSTDGAVTVEIAQGTFWLGSSSGADLLSVATEGTTVYVYNETTVAATNGSNTRSIAGRHVATDARFGFAIKLGNNQTAGGGF